MRRQRFPTLKQVFDDPRFESWQSRRGRRALSVTLIALSIAVAGALANLAATPGLGWWPVLLLAATFLAWVVVAAYLNGSVAGATELGDRDLDEVQQALRDRAYRRAYPVAIVAMSVLFLLTLFALGEEPWVSVPLIVSSFALLWFAVLTTPVHVLAWTLPDHDG